MTTHARGCGPLDLSASASPRSVEKRCARVFQPARLTAGSNAGIAKRVHPHGLRHTHAAQLRAEGVDIGIISKQLGHRSISTTAVYLDHIAPYAVVEAVRAREW